MQKLVVGLLLAVAVDGLRHRARKNASQQVQKQGPGQQNFLGDFWDEVRRMAEAQPHVVLNPDNFPHCHLSESECALKDMTEATLVYTDSDTSRCYNGEPFAFFVHPGRTDKLLYYYPNGGACWEFPFVLPGAATACLPNMLLGLTVTGYGMGMTDFGHPNNTAFHDYTFVSPPYCGGGAHVANNTITGPGGPFFQYDYNNNNFLMSWALQNVDQTLESLVIAGSSAGSIGAMAWADFMLDTFQYRKATVIVDSYMGVFPDGSQGRTIKNFGVCNLPIFTKWKAACESETANIQDVFADAIESHPDVAFAAIQPKWDLVQRAFFGVIALTYFNLDLYQSSERFYETTNSMMQRYSKNPNFVNYYVDGGFHTFYWYPMYYTASVGGELGQGGTDGKPKLWEWTTALVNHEPVQSQCMGVMRSNGGDGGSWFEGTKYCDKNLYPKTLGVTTDKLAARRMVGFNRIWAMASAAGWHAANDFKGYSSDAERDLQERDAEAVEMGNDWQDSPALQPIAQSLKWMAQDYAWWVVNNMWFGVPQWLSSDYSKYLEHQDIVKRALNGAGSPPDELFWRINHMISEHVWVAAHTRYWGQDQSYDNATAHKGVVDQLLNQILAEEAWPLFGQ